MCCGFGGTFSLDYPKVAQRIAQHKVDHIEATGVDTVIADNPGCIMHLRGVLQASGKPVRVLHIAEAMVEALHLQDNSTTKER